jgi:hypothetical protein
MSTQSEQVLEDNLVKQLSSLGHNFVTGAYPIRSVCE